MITIPRAGAALLCLVSMSAPRPGEQLRFSVAPGTRVSREWSRESRRTLKQITVTAGDETKSDDKASVTIDSKARLVVSDTFTAAEDERPVRIVRRYDAIEKSAHESATTPDGERESDLKEVSDLAGRTIVFTWNEERGMYDCAFDEGEAGSEKPESSDTPLETLAMDMDLQGFLPSKPVSVGDEWPVSMDAIRYGFLRPGGRLEFRDEQGRRHSSLERAMSEKAWRALEGECTATLKEFREDGGARLGVIRLEGELSTSAEVESDDGSMTGGMEHSEVFEGELLWDVGASRARSMDIQSKIEFTLIESRQGKQSDGTPLRVRRTLEFGEESRCTYEIRTQ